jgi:hypothetical protein
MENKEIKKRPLRILSLWLLIAVVAAIGAFLLCRHFTKIISSNSSVGDSTSVTPSGTQEFSGNGFSFRVPQNWYVENNGKNFVTVYPDYAFSAASSTPPDGICKIEVSVFPYASNTNIPDWIAHRLGADPSVAVAEQSSADIVISGGTGVQWNGTIDGVVTTLVYAFSDGHAFEVAPSVVNETSGSDGNRQCADALDIFTSKLTLE